jgi:hypothetical protein
MVMSVAGTMAANEATRDRGDGESAVSTAFKFGILLIAVFGLVALLIGLWLFNNWAGIIDIPANLLNWALGGISNGSAAITGGITSFLFGFGGRYKGKLSGIDPSTIT